MNSKNCNKCYIDKGYAEFQRNKRGTFLYKTCNLCIITPMIKCHHCHASKLPIHFQKNGTILKTCDNCRKNKNDII
jgi:hypothetical protein